MKRLILVEQPVYKESIMLCEFFYYSKGICSHSVTLDASCIALGNHLWWLHFMPSRNWKRIPTSHLKVLTALQSAVEQILNSGQFGPLGFPVRAVSGILQKDKEQWSKPRQVIPFCLTFWCHVPPARIILF